MIVGAWLLMAAMFFGGGRFLLWFGYQQGRISGLREGFERGKDETLAALL